MLYRDLDTLSFWGQRDFSDSVLEAEYLARNGLLCSAKRGNAAPKTYRKRPFAAIADAPFKAWYVSTRYIPEAIKIHKLPHAKGIAATTGDAQDTSDRAVQANQKSPIAT